MKMLITPEWLTKKIESEPETDIEAGIPLFSKIYDIFHFHNMEMVKNTGLNAYYKCKCGKRKVLSFEFGYQPIDREWLLVSDEDEDLDDEE